MLLELEDTKENSNTSQERYFTTDEYERFVQQEALAGKLRACANGWVEADLPDLKIWDDGFDLLVRAMDSNSQGRADFFDINTPHGTLITFIESSQRLIYLGKPELATRLEGALNLLESHLDDYSDLLFRRKAIYHEKGDFATRKTLEALTIIACSSKNIESKERASEILMSFLPDLIERIPKDSEYDRNENVDALVAIYSQADRTLQETIRSVVIDLITDKKGDMLLGKFEEGSRNGRVHMMGLASILNEILRQELSKYELDSELILHNWTEVDDDVETLSLLRVRSIPRMFRVLRGLESNRKGAVRELHRMFGLNNFYYYPLEMLIRQYDERFDNTKPYGVIWTPSQDYSGWTLSNMEAVSEFYSEVEGTNSIRFIEAKSRIGRDGILRRLRDLHSLYYKNDEGKLISFLIIMGHSFRTRPDLIHLGHGYEEDSYLRAKDLENRRAVSLASLFVENPDIILLACKVNKYFKEVIEKVFDGELYAWDEFVGGLTSLKKRPDSKQLKLVPKVRFVTQI